MAFATAEPLRPPAPAAPAARASSSPTARARRSTSPAYDAERTELRVAVLRGQARLEPWCAARGVEEALVGGFFVRPDGTPLGEVRTRGVARRHVPFDAPWDAVRACVHVAAAASRASRRATSCPPSRAATCCRPARCSSATARRSSAARTTRGLQRRRRPSSTPTSPTAATRAPRWGWPTATLFAVACDGRSRHDAGLTLEELAALMAALGCSTR